MIACGAMVSAQAFAEWPEPIEFWTDAAATSEVVDHGEWQAFLDEYLVVAEDGVNRVRYDAAREAAAPGLYRYLRDMATLDPRQLSRDEQMAYWINLYNALTVRVVLENPGKNSIRRMGGFFSIGPWGEPVVRIEGRDLSLDDIEHRILRPIWQDHRIHFAVNCASIGCPNLMGEAFRGDNLERLLDAGEQSYLQHARGFDREDNGKIHLSSIFKWYRQDFAPDEDGVLRYVERTLGLDAGLLGGRVSYDYDWLLNAI